MTTTPLTGPGADSDGAADDDRAGLRPPRLSLLLLGGALLGLGGATLLAPVGAGPLGADPTGGTTIALLLVGLGLLLRPRGPIAPTAMVIASSIAIALGATAAGATVRSATSGWHPGPPGVGRGVGWGSPTATRTLSSAPGVTRVEVDSGHGDLRVRQARVDRAQVTARLYGDADLALRDESGAAVIDADCGGGWADRFRGRGCRADLELTVPVGTAVVLDHGAGGIDVAGLDGDVEISTGAAEVTLADLSGGLRVDGSVGQIHAEGLRSDDVAVSTGAGDVVLGFLTAPADVTVDAGVGSVEVVVPRGAYDVDVSTGVGEERLTGVVHDASAAAAITVDAGAGEVVVRGR